MNPESTSITFRPELAQLATEFMASNDAQKFVGMRACPVFNAATQSGEYPVLNREYFKKPADVKRAAPGTAYNLITGKFGQLTFNCEDYGITSPVDDRQLKVYGRLFNLEEAALKICLRQMLLAHEQRVAALYAAATMISSNTGNTTTAWTTVADAVPLNDIMTGINTICDKCNAVPGDISMIIPRVDFLELMRTTQFINKSQYTYPGIIPAQMNATQVAGILGIKEVLVASGAYDSTEEGVAETSAQIWAAAAIYLAVTAAPGSDLMTPSACRTITWNQGGPDVPIVETWREDKLRSGFVRVRADMDEIATGEADLFAYRLTNT